MRGSIVKRSKGSYTIILELGLNPSTGKRRQQWITVRGNKRDAEKRLAELLHQLDTGTFIKPGKVKLADFLKRWITDYVYPNLAPRTAEGYESIVRQHLIPKLGNISLIQLKPEHIQQFYAESLKNGRRDGRGSLSTLTVRHHHMALHNALKHAVRWGLLMRNPADAIDTPRCTHSEMRIMSEDDLNKFLNAAKSTPYYTLFYIALFTGMRRSELLGLRWSDVDFSLSHISISRTMHRLRNGVIIFRPPKTAKGRRIVSLSPSTVPVLEDHREKQKAIRLIQGLRYGDSDLVFSKEDGEPLIPNAVTSAWLRLVRRVGLKGIRLHDARHTHASLMLKQGVHPKIVQERLGHSTIAITLDTYSHVTPGLQEAAAKRFDEILEKHIDSKV